MRKSLFDNVRGKRWGGIESTDDEVDDGEKWLCWGSYLICTF